MAGNLGSEYNIYDTGMDKNLVRGTVDSLDIPFPELDNPNTVPQDASSSIDSFSGGLVNPLVGTTAPGDIRSGEIPSLIGFGKKKFTDTIAGYLMGLDQNDNIYKWIVGSSTSSADWAVTTANTFTVKGTITATAGIIGGWTINATTLTGGDTTLDSTGVITLGTGNNIVKLSSVDATYRIWVGNATAASATFSVTKAGAILATSGAIGGWTLGTTSFTGTGVTLSSTGDAYLAFGVTPPTSPILGTGIFINKTGLFGLSANTQNFAISATDGSITAIKGTIGGFTITSGTLYGSTIKTAATVGAGSTGVIMDTAGLRGYDSVLGNTFNLPTDGSAPTFSSGIINYTVFNVNTNAVIRTSTTVGDGTVNSAGILINNTGLYGCQASQTLANANIKVLVDGSVTIKGAITADTGYIGGTTGWVITSNYIKDVAGVTGLSSVVTGGDDIRIWAGHATPASAPFYVTEAGTLVATSATITGAITASSGSITGAFSVLNSLSIGTSGNIKSGQTAYNTGTGFFLEYNGGTPRLSLGNPSSSYLTWDGTAITVTDSKVVYSFTCGENITAGNAVIVGDGSTYETTQTNDSGAFGDLDNTKWYGQVFTAEKSLTITRVIIKGRNPFAGGKTITLAIRAVSSNLPTGADLVSKDLNWSFEPSGTTEKSYTFDTPLTVTPGAQYAIVVRSSDADNIIINNDNSAGAGVVSTDSGSSWSGSQNDLYYKINEVSTVAGNIYKTDASNSINSVFHNNFIGFATETISAGSSCRVNLSAVNQNQTGLTVGVPYYLSNTAGAISTSAGDNSKKVGLSLSTTTLLILNS